MAERKDVVTLGGNPMTLVGDELKVGDKAPDFKVVNRELKPVDLKGLGSGLKLVSVVPSLDTPICEIQTKKFYEEVAAVDGVTLATVSMDLPFAQARFCQLNGIEDALVLSDYQEASFGKAWGVLIKEVRLLARSVFILDDANVVKYVELVGEVGEHPDYDKALAALKSM